MGYFEWLPKTDKCCCCVRNLKCASFMIVIFGMITSASIAENLCAPFCEDLYNVSSPIHIPVNILRWILFISEVILIASAFAFLLGIFWAIPVTADIFIGAILLKCVVTIFYGTLIVIQEQYTYCQWYDSQLFSCILVVSLWAYFAIVVNSYADEM